MIKSLPDIGLEQREADNEAVTRGRGSPAHPPTPSPRLGSILNFSGAQDQGTLQGSSLGRDKGQMGTRRTCPQGAAAKGSAGAEKGPAWPTPPQPGTLPKPPPQPWRPSSGL